MNTYHTPITTKNTFCIDNNIYHTTMITTDTDRKCIINTTQSNIKDKSDAPIDIMPYEVGINMSNCLSDNIEHQNFSKYAEFNSENTQGTADIIVSKYQLPDSSKTENTSNLNLYYYVLELSEKYHKIIFIESIEKSEKIQNDLINQLMDFFDKNEFFVKDIKPLGIVSSLYQNLLDNICKNVSDLKDIEFIFSEVSNLDNNISKFIKSTSSVLPLALGRNWSKAPLDIPTFNSYIVYNKQTKISKFFTDIHFNLEKTLGLFKNDLEVLVFNDSLSIKVSDLFDNKLFNSFDDVKLLYSSLEELEKKIKDTDINHKLTQPNDAEEERLKSWILFNYDISGINEPDYRIKASHFSEIIEQHFVVNSNDKFAFRNRLSKYLLAVGLNKKRFSDGFYYYGIRSKSEIKTKQPTELNLENILKERQEQLELFS